LRRVRFAQAMLVVLLGVMPSVVAGVSANAENAVTTRTILSVKVADSPPAPVFIALVRTVLPQGTINRNIATDGVWSIAVESGALTMASPEANGGQDDGFLRAADLPPSYRSSSPGGQSQQTVTQGDALVFTDPPAFTIGNAGADSSTYLEIILAPHATLGLVRHITMDLIVVDPIAIANVDLLPADPVEIRLEEIEIGQGSSLAFPASAGPRMLIVRSGTATTVVASGTVTLRPDVGIDSPTAAVGDQTLVSGKSMALKDRDELVVQAGASGEVKNSGSEPVILWSLSVVSVTKSTYSPGS
jgi:hypothetical protein